jgi:hypothetical protein
MTPAAARAMYDRQFASHGEDVTIRSGGTESAGRARVTGFKPEELTGAIQQGDRKVILLADGLSVVPASGDTIIVRGEELNIEAVDDSTRRVAGELIAYEIVARGE